MTTVKSNAGWVIALVIAVIALVIGVGARSHIAQAPQVRPLGAEGDTNLTSLVLDQSLTVTATTTLDGYLLKSYAKATSTTGTTVTLSLADFNGYNTVLFTPNIGATTLIFPASTTLSAWLPTAGDTQSTCFYNATTTAAATIQFQASAGIDWEVASSTGATGGAPTALNARSTGCFTFVRQNSTSASFDISALYIRYVDAD